MSQELARLLEDPKALQISIATSDPRGQDALDEYAGHHAKIQELPTQTGLQDPIPFANLWEWRAPWTDASLPEGIEPFRMMPPGDETEKHR